MSYITDVFLIKDYEEMDNYFLPPVSYIEDMLKRYTADEDYHHLRLEEDMSSSFVTKGLDNALKDYVVSDKDYTDFMFNVNLSLMVLGYRFVELKHLWLHMTWEDFQKQDVAESLSLYEKDKSVIVYYNTDTHMYHVGTLAHLVREIPHFGDKRYCVCAAYSRHTAW